MKKGENKNKMEGAHRAIGELNVVVSGVRLEAERLHVAVHCVCVRKMRGRRER